MSGIDNATNVTTNGYSEIPKNGRTSGMSPLTLYEERKQIRGREITSNRRKQ